MSVYNTADPVPLSFARVRNGSLVTSLSVSVRVVNVKTGATLLTTTALSEVTPGVYSYNWVHTLGVFTECVALYTVGALTYPENITISEELQLQQESGGRAN